MKQDRQNSSANKLKGKNTAPLVPSVEHAARILMFFGQHHSSKANLTEICAALGIYKSRGHAILKTLMAYGLVERDEATKHYSLGPNLIFLARQVLKNIDIREKATPFLRGLSAATGCTALLGIISGDNLIVVAKEDGHNPIGVTIEMGFRFHLMAGAHGKVIVSFLPAKERKKILAGKKLYFHGKPENLNRTLLQEEIAFCQKNSYALDMGKLQKGIHAVAAPVFSGKGTVTGVILIIGTFPEKTAHLYGLKAHEAARALAGEMGVKLPDRFYD
jgi:DNA-binding IclR family transcriptional regulator